MSISVFDLFKIGIGPSSSHTVGPMLAANRFIEAMIAHARAGDVSRIKVDLFGSLGATGKGHGSDKAVLLGLQGAHPKTVDVETIEPILAQVRDNKALLLPDDRALEFVESRDLVMHKRRSLPFHPNGMTFTAFDAQKNEVFARTYFSVGGGFVVDENAAVDESPIKPVQATVPYPFTTGDRLLELCKESGLSIAAIMMANETVSRSEQEVRLELLDIWDAMKSCVQRCLLYTSPSPRD